MEISVTTVSDGRTRVRIYNPAPGFLKWQRFRLYPPDYDGTNPIDSPESSNFDSLEMLQSRSTFWAYLGLSMIKPQAYSIQ